MDNMSFGCKLGILSRSDGSALFCEGETTAIAGVCGPVEVKLQKIQIDKASVECNYRPKTSLPGVKDRFYESLIRNICETAVAASLYPRAAVLINIQEMYNSGHLISCAINAACLALLDSGIDMKCMFAAVTCFLNTADELCLIAPLSLLEIKATFVFVFDNIENKIVASHTEGSFSQDQFETALNLCRVQSGTVFQFFKSKMLPSS